ncbi:Peptidase family M28 [uncultured archaeon]|nr:Peptidase family M28 [uncultured archaeon]
MNKNLELHPIENSNPSNGSESSKAFGRYITGMVDKVSLPDIKGTIAHLTGYSTRFTFSGKSAEAGQWIHEQFINMGYPDVEYQDFSLCDSLQKNVVCSKEGRGQSDKILILCAHYDSTAKSTTGWDWQTCPAPGANDNASGVAAMLEIARILRNVNMNYTIRFIAFTGEEQNLWGSRAYADYALSNKMNIVLVINLDEIGYPDAKPDWKIIIGEDQGNHMPLKNAESHRFAQVMKQAAADYTSLTSTILDIWTSDHMPFNSAGYVVIGVSQAGKYPHSHEVTDVYANIDIDYVSEVTRMTLATILQVDGMQLGKNNL